MSALVNVPRVMPQPATSSSFRDAMARVAAAVNIVTTLGPGGRSGFAATAVCSVTDTPPTLLVCLNRASSVVAHFAQNTYLCVNTLSSDQAGVAGLFGGKTPPEQRFASAAWTTGPRGMPMLDDSLASFECAVAQRLDVGTHTVLFCEVEHIVTRASREPAIYFGRTYLTTGPIKEP